MKKTFYTMLALLAMSFSAIAGDNNGPKYEGGGGDSSARSAASAGALSLSASTSSSGSVAANTTSVHQGAATLNAGASNSAATNGGQSVTFTSPSEVSTRASGTTELRTVATVVAPDMVTTANCIIGASGGATGLGWGFAIGGGVEDKGCTRRENARLLKNLGKVEAAVKIMCNDPEVAAALGADCAVAQPLPAAK